VNPLRLSRVHEIIALADSPGRCVPQSDITELALEVASRRESDRHPANLLPIPMRLPCPACSTLHIDEGEFATKPHHTHACQGCGMVWRPAIVPTVGVRFLPGFKNAEGK
jgi:hypothetical protein